MKKYLLTVLLGSLASATVFAATLEILPRTAPIPADDPMTPAKVSLGKQLYFDTRLSRTGEVSCQSCHDVTKGGDDSMAVSKGVEGRMGKRSSPTVWNAAFYSTQFWDGRVATLEEQAKGPLVNPDEMGNPDHKAVVERIKKVPGYVDQFKKVFGGSDPITIDNTVKAIAAFERTLITPDAPVDLYLKGKKSALSPAAKRGMDLVQSVGCTSCHMGVIYAGPKLPIGQGWFQKFPKYPSEYDQKYRLTEDLGRYLVTQKEEDKNVWRVPTWRNVALTAPYFHNGSVKTLDEAVRVMAKAQLNKTLKENEVSDIVAFLKALNGVRPKEPTPTLPR